MPVKAGPLTTHCRAGSRRRAADPRPTRTFGPEASLECASIMQNAGSVPKLYSCCKTSVQAPASSTVGCADSNVIRNDVEQSRGRKADRSERLKSNSRKHYAAFQSRIFRCLSSFGGRNGSSREYCGAWDITLSACMGYCRVPGHRNESLVWQQSDAVRALSFGPQKPGGFENAKAKSAERVRL